MFEVQAGRVALAVRNVSTSVHFYVDTLGFHVEQLFDDPPYATLALGPLRLSLTQAGSTIPELDGVRLDAGASGGSCAAMVVLEVPDACASWKELTRASVVTRSEPWEPPWGGCRFFVSDPDGYLVEVEQAV